MSQGVESLRGTYPRRDSDLSATNLRLAAIRAQLAGRGVRRLVVRDVANVTYLSAFDDVWDDEPYSLLLRHAVRRGRAHRQPLPGVGRARCERHAVAGDRVRGRPLGRGTGAGGRGRRDSRVAVESSAPYGVVEKARSGFSGEIVPIDGLGRGTSGRQGRRGDRSDRLGAGDHRRRLRPHPRVHLARA